MSFGTIFLICLFAVALGWFLGKFQLVKLWKKYKMKSWYRAYMQGIHLLINDQADQAIETIIETWDVNDENFELHNALANMLRRKGEVDRAIRIHANLVENEKLSKSFIRQATIELANDYVSAGLLDRAERLLMNVVNNSQDYEERCLELLQQIYQLEKEWDKAITVAEQLLPKRSVDFKNKRLSSGKQHIDIAHYYCELAQQALKDHHYKQAEASLDKAIAAYPKCGRAILLKAQLSVEKGNVPFAISKLDELMDCDPHLFVEALPLVATCFSDDSQAFVEYIMNKLESFPSFDMESAVFKTLSEDSPNDAFVFIREQVKKRPTLKGLDLLINEQMDILKGSARENLELLHKLVLDVLSEKPAYQCRECGFTGNQMHWLCPKCQQWDSIRKIRGSEGD